MSLVVLVPSEFLAKIGVPVKPNDNEFVKNYVITLCISPNWLL